MVVRGSGIGLRVRVAGRREATGHGEGDSGPTCSWGEGSLSPSLIKTSAWRCLSHSLLSFAKPNLPNRCSNRGLNSRMKPPKIGFFVTETAAKRLKMVLASFQAKTQGTLLLHLHVAGWHNLRVASEVCPDDLIFSRRWSAGDCASTIMCNISGNVATSDPEAITCRACAVNSKTSSNAGNAAG